MRFYKVIYSYGLAHLLLASNDTVTEVCTLLGVLQLVQSLTFNTQKLYGNDPIYKEIIIKSFTK